MKTRRVWTGVPSPLLVRMTGGCGTNAVALGWTETPSGGSCMRLILAALCVATCTSMASAQTQSEPKQPADSQHSTGHTVLPDDNKGQLQPQGWTGPINTGSGGTPAASPEGPPPPGTRA